MITPTGIFSPGGVEARLAKTSRQKQHCPCCFFLGRASDKQSAIIIVLRRGTIRCPTLYCPTDDRQSQYTLFEITPPCVLPSPLHSSKMLSRFTVCREIESTALIDGGFNHLRPLLHFLLYWRTLPAERWCRTRGYQGPQRPAIAGRIAGLVEWHFGTETPSCLAAVHSPSDHPLSSTRKGRFISFSCAHP